MVAVDAQQPVAGQKVAVPVIDFKDLADPAKHASVIAQVARACETVGFFEVINSGIPKEVLGNAFDTSRDFFNLPAVEKQELAPNLKEKTPMIQAFQLGYKPHPTLGGVVNRMDELVFRNYHMREGQEEAYTNGDIERVADVDPTLNWWPQNPTDYRQKVETLLVELGKLGDTLLDVFSESLGLPPTYLRLEYYKNASVPRYLKCHRYPKSTQTKVDETGIIPHRDTSVFAIVSEGYGKGGLWINPYGEWVPVCPQEGGLVVNVGDILQAWSNGRFRSILHRVCSIPEAERHSFAYFCFPGPGPEEDLVIQPIPKLITAANPPTYVPFSYLDFFKNKMFVNNLTMLDSHEVKA